MAQRKKDGTYELETSDYMKRAIDDARKGRPNSPPGGLTAAQTLAYNEAYSWGTYFKTIVDRITL
jgi:hypothetical protein